MSSRVGDVILLSCAWKTLELQQLIKTKCTAKKHWIEHILPIIASKDNSQVVWMNRVFKDVFGANSFSPWILIA